MFSKDLRPRLVGMTIALFLSILFPNSLVACRGEDRSSLQSLARRVLAEEAAESHSAITALREAGSEGLAALFTVYGETIEQQKLNSLRGLSASADARWQALRTALDTVGQQRDCHASHLYWFTDLEQAKAASHTSGKPILSLRLLGKLNEELSCANSRFFRTTLYANAKVSQYLRDHFVLHWKSVRPVPRLTIDFGDGRRIERTITGNSIHYVLDEAGKPIDALPGLYGPEAFLEGLARAEQAAQKASLMGGAARASFLREYHRNRLTDLTRKWESDLSKVALALLMKSDAEKFNKLGAVTRQALDQAAADRARFEQLTDDGAWVKIAALRAESARLDTESIALIRSKYPTALAAGRVAISKTAVENPLLRAVGNLERSIALDTIRNEYLLHGRIHEWFFSENSPEEVEALNAKVYAELFLTPDSDPWLGLAPRDTYSALENDGLAR
jgi:hypothetical protein